MTIAEWLSETTMGKERIVCAMIMAEGVYSNPMNPRGPLLERRRYTKRPTTTGGNPMKEFRMLICAPFIGNLLRPRSAASGSPKMVAMIRAVPETFMDSNMMPSSSLSMLKIRANAFAKPSIIKDISTAGRGAGDSNSFCPCHFILYFAFGIKS